MSEHARLRGVFPILATPFDEDEALVVDEPHDLVRRELDLGVDGVVCLGVAGAVLLERLAPDRLASDTGEVAQ